MSARTLSIIHIGEGTLEGAIVVNGKVDPCTFRCSDNNLRDMHGWAQDEGFTRIQVTTALRSMRRWVNGTWI